jgi:hypothetical protein
MPYKIEPSGGEIHEIASKMPSCAAALPSRPWLSITVSYYYFGYVMLAMLTRLTGAVSG